MRKTTCGWQCRPLVATVIGGHYRWPLSAAVGGDLDEVAHAYDSLYAVLLVYACSCVCWLTIMLFLRWAFSNGRAAAKTKAYNYWSDLERRRAKVRAEHSQKVTG